MGSGGEQEGDAGRAEAAVSVAPAAAASATGAETAAPASSAEAAASAARLSWRAALNADQPAASVFWLCGARLPVAGWQAAAAPIQRRSHAPRSNASF